MSLERNVLIICGVLALGLAGCASVPVIGKRSDPAPTLDFESQIKPILERRCVECHSGERPARGLNLETYALANSTWRGGPVIVPGEPERSMLLQVVRLDVDTPAEMLASHPHVLTYDEREKLRIWIEEGAKWPAGTPKLTGR